MFVAHLVSVTNILLLLVAWEHSCIIFKWMRMAVFHESFISLTGGRLRLPCKQQSTESNLERCFKPTQDVLGQGDILPTPHVNYKWLLSSLAVIWSFHQLLEICELWAGMFGPVLSPSTFYQENCTLKF